VALEFGLAIVAYFCGKDKSEALRRAVIAK